MEGALGAPVSPAQAQQAADVFFASRFSHNNIQAALSEKAVNASTASASLITVTNAAGVTIGYVRQYSPVGYVVLRADTQCPPTKIYSEDGVFEKLPPGFAAVIKTELEKELVAVTAQTPTGVSSSTIAQANTASDVDYPAEWAGLLTVVTTQLTGKTTASGADIIAANSAGVVLVSDLWNQDAAYNYYAPAASGGPSGRAYAGCVACAMSMVLHYHQQPTAVSHDHSYTDTDGACRGTHSISDAGMTSYQWDNMPTSISTTSPLAQRQAIGQLMYHCGVAVEMDFEANGSGAFPSLIPAALANYFNYTSSPLLAKSDYTATAWFNMIKADIDASKPIIWAMWDAQGQLGHCVVVDGYNGTNQVHFNLGWSGSYNVWCNLASAVPPDNWVTHMAVFQITPKTVVPQTNALTIKASGAGTAVPITVSPSDMNDLASGSTPLTRQYADGTQIFLTAPQTVGASIFAYWRTADGNISTNTIGVTASGNQTCTAVYDTVPVPTNDTFTMATTINPDYSGTITATNTNASVQPGEPKHANTGPFNSVWWTFVAPKTTTITIDSHGSAFDTVLAVYTGGSVATLTQVASNDDDGSAGNCSGLVKVPITINQRYYIVVAGASATAAGTIQLNYSRPRGTIVQTFSFGGTDYQQEMASTSVGSDGGNIYGLINISSLASPGHKSGAGVYASLHDADTGLAVTWATVTYGGPPLTGPKVTVSENPTHSIRKCQLGLYYAPYGSVTATYLTGPVLVQDAHPYLPDFQIDSVTLMPQYSAPGDTVTALVAIRNAGTADGKAAACSITLDGIVAPCMSLDVGNLTSGTTRTLVLQFTAPEPGNHILHATVNAANGVQEESSTNNGMDFPFTVILIEKPTITAQPASATITSGQTASLTVTATGTPAPTYQWYEGTSGDMTTLISEATSQTFTTPALTATTSYWVRVSNIAGTANSNTATVTMKTTPAIIWANPAAIPYGTALSVTQLNAKSSVPGTFAYTPDAGTILPASTQILNVAFTPTDTVKYTSAQKSVSLVVAMANQMITFGALSDQTYGNAPFTVNATASSGLTPVFTIVSGSATISGNTVTLTGVGTIVVRASQAGDSNYAAAPTVDQTFTVLPSFYSWRQDKALPVGKNGPNDDAAGYGVPNLMAYGLAFDPKVPPPTTSGVIPGIPAVSINGTNIRLEFVKDSNRSDIEVTTEVSSDLVTWTTVPHAVVESSGSLQHCRAEQPLGTNSRKFMRVRIRQLTPAP